MLQNWKYFFVIVSSMALLYKVIGAKVQQSIPVTEYQSFCLVRFLVILMVMHLNKNETQVTEDSQILMPCTIFTEDWKAWTQHVKENICLKKGCFDYLWACETKAVYIVILIPPKKAKLKIQGKIGSHLSEDTWDTIEFLNIIHHPVLFKHTVFWKLNSNSVSIFR
jgi:hypothetical protein